jgi:uncharacterized integral membrane protein (TIGR00698 family)
MTFSKAQRPHTFHGILFVALFATAASYLAELPIVHHLGISPLIIGILLGIIYANTLRNHLPEVWVPGILFSMKTLLRIAIIFYGFRITFQTIAALGINGVLVGLTMVTTTFILGYFIGVKLLKLDRDTTILVAAGSSICGAAAVLATEPVLKSDPYKSAIAVGTVLIFGTIAMFLYPALYHFGLIPFTPHVMGIYIGGTLHEVAHVVAAGHAISQQTADTAVIVKMTRVMMLAPFLLLLSIWLFTSDKHPNGTNKLANITIPWFAIMFICAAGIHSLHIIPESIINFTNKLDTFGLTMAMSAMGMETQISKFKGVGLKPLYLATLLFSWLIFGGFYIVRYFYS